MSTLMTFSQEVKGNASPVEQKNRGRSHDLLGNYPSLKECTYYVD